MQMSRTSTQSGHSVWMTKVIYRSLCSLKLSNLLEQINSLAKHISPTTYNTPYICAASEWINWNKHGMSWDAKLHLKLKAEIQLLQAREWVKAVVAEGIRPLGTHTEDKRKAKGSNYIPRFQWGYVWGSSTRNMTSPSAHYCTILINLPVTGHSSLCSDVVTCHRQLCWKGLTSLKNCTKGPLEASAPLTLTGLKGFGKAVAQITVYFECDHGFCMSHCIIDLQKHRDQDG